MLVGLRIQINGKYITKDITILIVNTIYIKFVKGIVFAILLWHHTKRVILQGGRTVGREKKDYKTLSASIRQQLLELGFEITEEGKHYRLIYYGDGRYKTTIAKTGSDWREGKNIASVILKSMM